MKKALGGLLLMVVAAAFLWVPEALASSITFLSEGGNAFHYSWNGINRDEAVFGPLFGFSLHDLTPTKGGAFSLQQSATVYSNMASLMSKEPENYNAPGPPYTTLLALDNFPFVPGDIGYWQLFLDQSGPLPFTDLTIEIKMMSAGVETSIFTFSADAALIANGGYREGSSMGSFIIGPIFVPVTMSYSDYPSIPGLSGWYANGSGPVDANFTLTMTGNVVPLPSTMLLLGSGLLGLVGWRRIKKG